LEPKIETLIEYYRQVEIRSDSQITPDKNDESRRRRQENSVFIGVENFRRLMIDCAELYAEKGQPERAIELFEIVLKYKPDWMGHLYRASFYKKLGKYQEAIDDLTFVLSKLSKHSEALIERGDLYALTKQLDNAITDYESAKAIDKNIEAKMNEKIAEVKQKMLENAN
jgi:tetratricopeptide (TPR) repeat protein